MRIESSSPSPREKWPDTFLASMRQVGDPLADATIAKIFERCQIQRVNQLLTTLIHNDDIPPEGLDAEIYDYLRATSIVPAVNADLIREGQEFFVKHGNLALFVLVCASLPECYVLKRGINVLWLTQRLEEHVLRRLLETADMVISVMSVGGLERGGSGLRTAAKVRLMHAAIRHLILHEGQTRGSAGPTNFAEVLQSFKWDRENLGHPLNQEDLVFTLLTFSYVIPRSLEKLEIQVTPAQKEAFIHTWNVVGRVMGIQEDLLPGNYEEARWLFERIKDLEGGESKEGQAMTAGVIKCLKVALPGHRLDFLPALFIRKLVDEKTLAWLGVSEPGMIGKAAQKVLTSHIKRIAWIKHGTCDRLLLTTRIWKWAAGHILDFLSNYKQPPGWKRENFKIPDHLATHWKADVDVEPRPITN